MTGVSKEAPREFSGLRDPGTAVALSVVLPAASTSVLFVKVAKN
jgi:hypothetical protein